MKTYIVDSFTSEMFKGNPAGVCFVENELSDGQMLSIAQELNLSETAFIEKKDSEKDYSIRFFSPKMEIPLCGHATLAAAKVIFDTCDLDEIIFTTIENVALNIARKEEKIEMEFPIYQTYPATVNESLLQALGIDEVKNCVFNKETNILLLEIGRVQILRDLNPDFGALYKAHDSINGVLVTAVSDNHEYDFYSRYFWPWSGTNEDPVTGGTHTFLAKYWGDQLKKTTLKSFQCSQRTGFMELKLLNDKSLLIRASAVCVLEGELKLKIDV